MAIFTVLEPPDGQPDRVAFVPEGFSVAALLFTVLWALWQRMWVVAAMLFALSAALTVAVNTGFLGQGLGSLLQFAIALVFALEAHALKVRSLEGAGYRHAGLVEASNAEAAELSYFACRVPIALRREPPRPSPTSEDTLGIFGNV